MRQKKIRCVSRDASFQQPIIMASPDSAASELLDYINEHWYYQATKRARWMDLIGDYAGDEPFIIDGKLS